MGPSLIPPGEWIWESLFQEFNLETGELVFEWRASQHLSVYTSYAPSFPATEQEPWDWFHINMVEKDDLGNYLVSARHLRSILYIDGRSGDVLWRFGGMESDFQDLSGGEATFMVGQHDAHWDEDHRFITFFDNRADWVFEVEHVSKGKRVELDLVNMTATINSTFVHPMNIFAFSQGSYQTLPNRNVLLGYGYTGAVAEFSPSGTLLCDAFLQPSSRFSSGDVQSYRNMKFNWTGKPLTEPRIIREDRTVYISWHGSTEVRSWALQHAFSPDEEFMSVQQFSKTGFETEFIFQEGLLLRPFMRVIALDKEGQELATSNMLYLGPIATEWPSQDKYIEAAQNIHVQSGQEMTAFIIDCKTSDFFLLLGCLVSTSGLLTLWILRSHHRTFTALNGQRLHYSIAQKFRPLGAKMGWRDMKTFDLSQQFQHKFLDRKR